MTRSSQRVVLLFDNNSHEGDWANAGAIVLETREAGCRRLWPAGEQESSNCPPSTPVFGMCRLNAKTGEQSLLVTMGVGLFFMLTPATFRVREREVSMSMRWTRVTTGNWLHVYSQFGASQFSQATIIRCTNRWRKLAGSGSISTYPPIVRTSGLVERNACGYRPVFHHVTTSIRRRILLHPKTR
jgi:hypothetical protein